MKRILSILLTITVCLSFYACSNDKSVENKEDISVILEELDSDDLEILKEIIDEMSAENEDQEKVDSEALEKLKNDTPEEAATTFLRSLCENDYELFLLIAGKSDSVKLKERYESMRKGYEGKDYTEIPIQVSDYSDKIIHTEQYDKDGNKQVFTIVGEKKRDAVMKIHLYKKEDGKYYFSEVRLDY